MSKFYNGKRSRNLYDPTAGTSFKLSRSRLALFLECPRCFYVDRRLGVDRPPGFPFNLNSAVDTLLKKEFDVHRAKGTKHPMMAAYGIDAIPYPDKQLDQWRDALRGGIMFHHKPTNLTITGGIDDLWVSPSGELHIVDYKCTSKDGEVSLDAEWQNGYKQQVEIYQWLFRQNGYKVSPLTYFVYCNGRTDRKAFDAKLEFDIKIISYKGNDTWVEPAVYAAHQCLTSSATPSASENCDYCRYLAGVGEVTAKTPATLL